jgi:hypothetical protein
MSHARFQKQERERARRAKAQAKRDRREANLAAAEQPVEGSAEPSVANQADVLAELAELHDRFGAGEVEFVDFEREKQELMERLNV